jgi:pyruvate,water dikinase
MHNNSISTTPEVWSDSCIPLVASTERRLVVPLDDAQGELAVPSETGRGKLPEGNGVLALLGGKGANLAALRAAGLPVPAGFCVTTDAYRQFVGSCAGMERLWTALQAIKTDRIEDVQSLGAQVRVRLAAAPLPKEVRAAVVAAWRQYGATRTYAVRSSATCEDKSEASFAGQGETFLNICGYRHLLEAVRACWISLFSDRAVAYRSRNQVDHREAAMAVVVQEFILPEVAGVLFTADPVSGDSGRIVIEASYGLGSSLVNGHVSPDRLVLSRKGLEVLECAIGNKAVETAVDKRLRARQRPVDATRVGSACLDGELARRLGRLALEAEDAIGGPQDMEWAAANGRLFLLQSRPITTLHNGEAKYGARSTGFSRKAVSVPPGQPLADRSTTSAVPSGTTWSNMNSWEILPDVVTPMSWSVVNAQFRNFFRPLLTIFGIDIDCHPLFGLIAGHAYANLDTFAEIVRALPGLNRLDFSEGLGGDHGELLTELVHRPIKQDWKGRLRRLARWPRFIVWAVGHAVDRRSENCLAGFRRHVDRLTSVNVAGMSEAELIHHLAALLNIGRRYGPDTAASVAVSSVFVRLFFNFVRRHMQCEDGAFANRMLGGLNGLASADAGLDLWQLAAWTHRHAALADIVSQAADFASIRRELADAVEGPEFLARWDQFMLRHGHHAFGEMDVHNPRWSERPDTVLDLLRGYVAGLDGADPRQFQRRLARQRGSTAGEFRRRLTNPLVREYFEFLFRKAQIGIALRENARNECVRVLAAMRQTLLELGERLARRGMLTERDDIFFTELQELEPLVAGAELGSTIAARKSQFSHNQTITPPPIVVGELHPQSATIEAGAPPRILHGLAASAGVARGRARVILHPQDGASIKQGEILVAPHTDPGWTPYFLSAAGIVMDVGGMLSHGTIVAREYGIPAVVNVGSATRTIKTGQIITVDGNRGVVSIE